MLRVFKGDKHSFKTIPTDSIDMSKAIIINSLEDLKNFKKKDSTNMKLIKDKFNSARAKKDSLN